MKKEKNRDLKKELKRQFLYRHCTQILKQEIRMFILHYLHSDSDIEFSDIKFEIHSVDSKIDITPENILTAVMLDDYSREEFRGGYSPKRNVFIDRKSGIIYRQTDDGKIIKEEYININEKITGE